MWNFFQMIITSVLSDQGILNEYFDQVFTVIVNLINKAPEDFKTAAFTQANGQTMTPLDMTCQLMVKCFEIAQLMADEISTISVVSLSFGLLENVQGIQSTLPGLMELYLKELGNCETSDCMMVLLQGLLMCCWYDHATALTYME